MIVGVAGARIGSIGDRVLTSSPHLSNQTALWGTARVNSRRALPHPGADKFPHTVQADLPFTGQRARHNSPRGRQHALYHAWRVVNKNFNSLGNPSCALKHSVYGCRATPELDQYRPLISYMNRLLNMKGHLDSVQALVLHGAKDLKFESRPTPQPAHDEVQVSIQATGLCGSDLHYYLHGRNGNFVLRHPLVLGHEASGVVTAVPLPPVTNGTAAVSTQSATSLQPGDRVALEVGLPCRNCTLCTAGRYNLCTALRFKSSAKTHPHLDGTLQTTITHPASLCHKLPPSVTFDEGALIEPLSVSLHAINRSVSAGSNSSTPLPGSSALVVGAGAVGILTAVALSVSGVSNILIVDIDEPRLNIAKSLSNGRFNLSTYLLPRTKPPTEVSEQLTISTDLATTLTSHAGVHGFDRVFECTGLPSCVQVSIFAAAPGAKVVLVGMGNPVQTLPLGAAALREVDIIGVFRYANCYPPAIALFASGKLAGVAEGLVTHRVRLEEGERAFRLAANQAREGEDEGRTVVKVVVVP